MFFKLNEVVSVKNSTRGFDGTIEFGPIYYICDRNANVANNLLSNKMNSNMKNTINEK